VVTAKDVGLVRLPPRRVAGCSRRRAQRRRERAVAPYREGSTVIAASTYPFLEVFWTMLIFFAFVVWLWILFTVIIDIFRRHDTSGWAKVAWIVLIILLPYLGVFVYLIAEHKGMTERAIKQQEKAQAQMADYVRSVAPGGDDPAEQIAKAKQLLDQGTISQAEFDTIKQKALAT
jgi:hypothetical protein